VGLFRKVHQLHRQLQRFWSPGSRRTGTVRPRICALEPCESRQLLSFTPTPIEIGAVYYEDAGAEDAAGDILQISWSGGEPGTQLTKLTIDTDKLGDGLSIGDAFFDTAAGGLGDYAAVPLSIVSSDGFTVLSATVVDGGTKLELTFSGFDAGETLVLSIDVDEQGFVDPDDPQADQNAANAVCEGKEFEGSKLLATFSAAGFYEVSGTGRFRDSYSVTAGLNLPGDTYMPPGTDSHSERTAGAFFDVTQTPLPITIAGNVYEDLDLDNVRDSGEQGIAGVTLALLEIVDGQYVATGKTAITDANGQYKFDNITPGTYRIVETQPTGYLSVGATAGTVGGSTRGVVTSVDVLSSISLVGGDDSVNNDFAEVKPATLSGYVYHDADNDGLRDSGETGIAGTTIQIQRLAADGSTLATLQVQTDANGYWSATGLMPGVYRVLEVQPTGYLDGLDAAGTAGGTAYNPGDRIDGIHLTSGQNGQEYDFGELLPATISGRVVADADADGQYDSGETLLSGVTVYLLDASGSRIATAVTDANGEYRFTNLAPGTYGVEEVQPDGFYDGLDTVGSAGGSRLAPDSIIDIHLASGVNGVRYDFYELLPASLSGYVYVDDNNNGVRNAGETGIAGVVLQLLDANGQPTGVTTTTDANGYYRFNNLRPNQTYGVAEVQPTGYYDGLDTAGTAGGVAHNPGDSITGAVLASGTAGKNYNFGELRPASLGGQVILDANNNGRIDAGEEPIAGVTVWLLGSSGTRIASTTTDAGGYYLFGNLQPGIYGVEEIQPSAYLDGKDLVGTAGGANVVNDRLTAIVLTSGTVAIDYDFLEVPPATISGHVFQDGAAISVKTGEAIPDVATVRDGRFTSDDTPLAGVVLRLCDGSGAPLYDANGNAITTVTDENGFYQFTGLAPGVYTILEQHPDGYYDSIDTPGSNGGIAINPKDDIDPMILATLAVDPADDAIIRIPVSAGETAVSYNFSEVLVETVPDDPPTPPNPPNPPYNPPPSPPWTPLEPPTAIPVDTMTHVHSYYLPSPVQRTLSLAGGGGSTAAAYTWHLSVVNGGQPRRENEGSKYVTESSSVYFNPVSWNGSDMSRAEWLMLLWDQDKPVKKAIFGIEGARPVVGDFDGNGTIDIGVFFDGLWFLDLNGNGVWDDGDLWVRLGKEGDQPVTGDWDGDGKTDLGIFGPSWAGDSRAIANEPGLPDAANNEESGRFKNVPPPPEQATLGWRTMKRTAKGQLRADLIDHVFQYGAEGDIAVSGDWNGDGIANIGLFRGGIWYLDADGNGRWTPDDVYLEGFGAPGDLPVVGDWNGDGIDDLGIYRKGTWYLDTNADHKLDAHDKVFHLGGPHDRPFAADFNGDGIDEIGIYRDGHYPQNKQASDPGQSESPAEDVATRPTETTVQ